MLTHWGRVMHVCVRKITIIGSDNGLLPGQHQAIIWTNAGILLIRILGTNFREILSKIHTFFIQGNAFQNVVCKMAAIVSRPQCVKREIDQYLVTTKHNKVCNCCAYCFWWCPNYYMLVMSRRCGCFVTWFCYQLTWPMYTFIYDLLTHLPLVPHICINESGQHWLR